VGDQAGAPEKDRVVRFILATEGIFTLKEVAGEPGIGPTFHGWAHLFEARCRGHAVNREDPDYPGSV